jgi:Holliday junction resolvase-like predicted endonuclease
MARAARTDERVARTAKRFLMGRQVKECPMRFDVVAIEEVSGASPVMRLHKAAFSMRMQMPRRENRAKA